MAFEIIWTERASADLHAIIEELTSISRDRARRMVNAIMSHVQVLRTFPRIGPHFPGDPRRIVREVLAKKSRVIYRVDEDREQVIILTVWHGSRRDPDLARLLDDPN